MSDAPAEPEAPETPASPAEGEGAAAEPDATDSAQGEPSGTPAPSAPSEAVAATAQAVINAATSVFAADARAATAGGFTVEGGTPATGPTPGTGDYFFDTAKGTLLILSSTPLTVSTSAQTTNNIEIYPGIKADLTLAGVDINSAKAPINLVTNSDKDGDGVKVTNANQIADEDKTFLYLTLAEGKTNTLKCSASTGDKGYPGIRCGWGSILVIDDAVTNVRQGGSKFNLDDIVTPEKGMVPYDVTLIDGKTKLKAGETPTKMDAKECVLNVVGGTHSAGIGSGPEENAGTIVVNGGKITSRVVTKAESGNDWGASNGAGIGAGSAGSGTVMIFNGGTIDASGGSCGTGIGSALGYWDSHHYNGAPMPDAIEIPTGAGAEERSGGYSFKAAPKNVEWFCCKTSGKACPVHYLIDANSENYFTVAGDITVNGGFITTTSGEHGNAFGQSCAHGPSSNRNHVIRVTGGTLLTNVIGGNPGSFRPDASRPPVASLGAAYGYTIVTGGSIQLALNESTKKPAFQGIGDTAYNTTGITNWDDVEQYKKDHDVAGLPEGDKVQMLTIDLSSRFGAGENKTVPITAWKLEINNIEQEYGAPSYLNDGKLYLWVPESATGKNVTVTMSYLGDDGKEHDIEPLYVEEVGGSQGSTLKAYVDIDVDTLSAEQQAYFGSLKKAYNGLAFEPFTVSADKPIKITEKDGTITELKNSDKIEVSYQPYDERDGSPLPDSEVVTGKTMPSDTGVFRVQLVSKEKAETPEFANLYWGHRITGWAEITPVPAVLDLQGVEWGHLDVATGDWKPITQSSASGVAGNRLKLTFNVRSANTTALTCAAPTGSFQVKIDGKNAGDAIALTEEGVEASPHSSFEIKDIEVDAAKGGKETRHATVVTYYLDPANRDGLLELLAQAGDGGEHKVNIEYLADKNYIQGVDKNPENAKDDDTFIIPVAPEGDVKPEGNVTIKDDDPIDPDPDNPTGKMTIIRKTITANYSDFHKKDSADAVADFFALEVTSSSSAAGTWSVSNGAVADLIMGDDGKPALDKNGKVQIRVNSCGTSVITMEQKPNALYTGIKYILTVNVTPDPSIQPQVQIRLTQRNLTALAEAAGAQVAAFSLAAFPAASDAAGVTALAARSAADRTLMPPRPGDVIEYTVTGLNLTPGSAWQGAELVDAVDGRLAFADGSVQVAPNYATRTDKSTALGTAAFYDGFDWDGLDWKKVAKGDYTFSASTLKKEIGTVYGGQSTSVRFNATVPDGLGERPEDGDLPEIKNEPGGTGGYGKPEDGLDPGETADPAAPLPPENIVVVGDDAKPDPNDPDNPQPADPGTVGPTPVLPKDPAAADIVTTVKVETKDTEVKHEDDRILIGDTLTVTATSENVAPDSKLANAVIKVTLPKGADLKPGTIELVDAQGNKYKVPDSAYDPKTGIVAVNAGDLYGGEEATLTFEVEITSTVDTRDPEEGEDPAAPSRPDDFPIEGGTLGETPTDEWEREHPEGTDPGNPPAVPEEPKPGTPFVPTKPWPEIEDELVATPPATDPDMPPVLPRDPQVEGSDADISVTKTAKNTSRDDKTTHVGDTVRYTVVLANSEPHTMWYDAVFRDELPKGVELVPGSIKVTGPDGTERAVPDSAYDAATRTLGVRAGDVAGGRQSTLVFDVKVTEAAIGADIGNVANAYGTPPSQVDPSEVASGSARPAPGEPFKPSEGWESFARNHKGVANADAAYPEGTDAKGGVKPADKKPLAQTGDDVWALVGLPLLLCAATAAAMVLCLVRRGREEGAR
ncbi:DUF11 domain-containing protein [Enterorhabdus mucosicola]|uniref:DUF11 domain-containing protein n=1 Tax=Adlercreutzia mucosicola TaxID=580026 RepID=A0A6N8JJ66_9ACTN|nr:isopeptide-forming domain-containing fimbrial protein [Adlercreutzia mucosicola]MVX59913.1 DUF11 domain-containing protein [Adlercreutzia mucosicola]